MFKFSFSTMINSLIKSNCSNLNIKKKELIMVDINNLKEKLKIVEGIVFDIFSDHNNEIITDEWRRNTNFKINKLIFTIESQYKIKTETRVILAVLYREVEKIVCTSLEHLTTLYLRSPNTYYKTHLSAFKVISLSPCLRDVFDKILEDISLVDIVKIEIERQKFKKMHN